jgi:hypothetical protein
MHSLRYEGQFQNFQNVMKYVVVEFSFPNWVSWPMWWENGSHYYKATLLSGHVAELGLLRLCIMSSKRFKTLRWTASVIMKQRDLTNHVPIITSSLSSFSLLSLSSTQSTISQQLLPPFARQNETFIFVTSYAIGSAPSLDP